MEVVCDDDVLFDDGDGGNEKGDAREKGLMDYWSDEEWEKNE